MAGPRGQSFYDSDGDMDGAFDNLRNTEEDKAIDNLLSASLLRLKFEDRNDLREEVHGVRSLSPEETPELIRESLSRMDEEVEAILLASRENDFQHAYEQARYLPTTFVNDRDYRLKFLRCDLFDPVKAADRFIVHVDYLLHVFGPRALREHLKADFFVNEEAAALRGGNVQLLPFRDRSGRRVVVALSGCFSYPPETRVKLYFYFAHVAAHDCVETQRKGIILIAWCNTESLFDGKSIRFPGSPGNKPVVLPNGRHVIDSIPVRVISIHLCYPDKPIYRILRAFCVIAFGDIMRSRILFHHGTSLEMQYKLMGYGIPVGQLPATDTGMVKVKNHIQWLKMHKLIEKDPSAYGNVCECPGLNDVLFRRAGSCLAHPGNGRFKNLIESKKDEHARSNQTGKREITWSIVEEIENRNGRFFSWDAKRTCWVLMTNRVEIRQKVAMMIRDFNRHSKAAKNPQSNDSSTTFFKHQDGRKRKLDRMDGVTNCNAIFRLQPFHTRSLSHGEI